MNGRPGPELHVVIRLEELPFAYIAAWSWEDEERIAQDVEARRGLIADVAEAVAGLLTMREAA